ncbi:MAG: hypothetical protein P1P87_08475 [Trueperaceae bacterium]|nr:hypothetical protein [Trueperaceae bacterium]
MRRRRRAWLLGALVAFSAAFARAPIAEVEGGAEGGAGATPPTAVRYADPLWYDLVDVRWAVDADGRPVALELELAAVDPVRPLLQPILEAYLMVAEGGRRELLPGSGVVLGEDQGWSVAVRVTGQGAWAWQADGGAPGRALDVAIVGRVVRLAWPVDLSAEGRWAALSGVYDPFHATGWRAFAREPSPWTFATAEPGPPVVDVFPDDAASLAQVRAGRPWSPRRPAPVRAPVSAWWWWMVGGLALAFSGLAWRRVQPPGPPGAAPPSPSGVELIDDGEMSSEEASPMEGGAPREPVGQVESDAPSKGASGAADEGGNGGPVDGRAARASRYEAEDRPATGTATEASDADASTSAAPSSRTT